MKKSQLYFEQRWGQFAEWLIRYGGFGRARYLTDRFVPHILESKTVLDLGCGPGHIATVLTRDYSFDVTMVDTKPAKGFIGLWMIGIHCAKTLSEKHNIPYLFYDGQRLDFEDSTFDTVILSFVLHHATDPEAVLKEACRVSKDKIILLEEVYRSKWDKYLNPKVDRLVTMDFVSYENRRKTELQWMKVFNDLSLKIMDAEIWGTPFFPMTMYVLEK